jgi:hypothetical protein
VEDALDQAHGTSVTVSRDDGDRVALGPPHADGAIGNRPLCTHEGVARQRRKALIIQKFARRDGHGDWISEEAPTICRGDAKEFAQDARVASERITVRFERIECPESLQQQKSLTVRSARPHVPRTEFSA